MGIHIEELHLVQIDIIRYGDTLWVHSCQTEETLVVKLGVFLRCEAGGLVARAIWVISGKLHGQELVDHFESDIQFTTTIPSKVTAVLSRY